jgi:hypothetical protein
VVGLARLDRSIIAVDVRRLARALQPDHQFAVEGYGDMVCLPRGNRIGLAVERDGFLGALQAHFKAGVFHRGGEVAAIGVALCIFAEKSVAAGPVISPEDQ